MPGVQRFANVAEGAPSPTPSAQPVSYTDCVARCIGNKAGGLAGEEVLNSICGNILLALGINTAEAIAAAGPAITVVAACAALTFGLSIGAVIECFTACAPGIGRLAAVPPEGGTGEEFAIRAAGAPAAGLTQDQLTRLLQLASAISQAAAARGIQVTPVQVIQLLIQRQRAMAAGQRL